MAVLAADDNRSMLQLYTDYAAALNVAIETAGTPDELLFLAETREFAIVICDFDYGPQLVGRRTLTADHLEALRSYQPAARIIVCSAEPQTPGHDVVVQTLGDPGGLYDLRVAKPISLTEFVNLIKDVHNASH